eukprot:g407.t1
MCFLRAKVTLVTMTQKTLASFDSRLSDLSCEEDEDTKLESCAGTEVDGTRTLLNDLPIPSFASLIALLGKDPNSGRSNDPLPKCPAGIKETLAGFDSRLSDLSCEEDEDTKLESCAGTEVGYSLVSPSSTEILSYTPKFNADIFVNNRPYHIHHCCWACRLTKECGSWVLREYSNQSEQCVHYDIAFQYDKVLCRFLRTCTSGKERSL